MWRGSFCLRMLRALKSQRAAPTAVPGTSRWAAAVNPGAAAAPSWISRVESRKLSAPGNSEPRVGEEAAGADQQDFRGEDGIGGKWSIADYPEPVPSVFSIDDMASLMKQENAKDICVIELPPEMKYSSYLIIVSGSSARHLHAMAQYLVKMYKHLKKDTDPHVVIEGKETDDWLCIDFGNIVVHLMLPETREIYELEKLWTLRSHDDQLAQMVSQSLPDDFMLGLDSKQQ